MKKIYILGGGTFSHVRSHYSGSTPAFGDTAIQMQDQFNMALHEQNLHSTYQTELILTKMADPRNSNIVTNEDLELLIDKLIADPETKVIVFNAAPVDFDGEIEGVPSGKYAPRLETQEGEQWMKLTPTKKIIGKIRKDRKDIFVVGFKTTSNESDDIQYFKGLKLLKKNSLNLVLANDLVTRNNIIIAPEETRYGETTDRANALNTLVKMTISRMQNHFTRSTVVEGSSVAWNEENVPANLLQVVNHCIEQGAYKPFLGKTAGHFAVKVNEGQILTSIRKTNFNDLENVGLVKVESKNKDEVIAYGHRPSVGGQSQRIIFSEHPDVDCIVHFHCPVKADSTEIIPSKPQWPNECGSHECGQNTSNGLKKIDLGEGDYLKVVYLDEHGPNIVFSRKTNSDKVIQFIDTHFDLQAKTGGLVAQ